MKKMKFVDEELVLVFPVKFQTFGGRVVVLE